MKKYKLFNLVFYEHHYNIADAIAREKQLKSWQRKWKEDLIRAMNPEMRDLKSEID